MLPTVDATDWLSSAPHTTTNCPTVLSGPRGGAAAGLGRAGEGERPRPVPSTSLGGEGSSLASARGRVARTAEPKNSSSKSPKKQKNVCVQPVL